MPDWCVADLAQTETFLPNPSPSTREPGAQHWARAMRESGALCSAILHVVHPQLYDAGMQALDNAERFPRVAPVLQTWPSVFSRLQILINRETPFHRDSSGQPSWYDMLMTLGSYKQATLVLRNLGIEVAYTPGTVVALSSHVVHHGVSEVEPDRVCYAWFMDRHLHGNLRVDETGWMTRGVYTN